MPTARQICHDRMEQMLHYFANVQNGTAYQSVTCLRSYFGCKNDMLKHKLEEFAKQTGLKFSKLNTDTVKFTR